MLRKLFKILGWTLLVLIAIPLIAVTVILIRNKAFMGGTDQAAMDHLRSHAVVLLADGVVQPEDGPLFPPSAATDRIFLLGENHGMADLQQLDLMLFTHLNKQRGLRHYIAEMDSALAARLNTYLASPVKDEALLREVTLAMMDRIPQQASREYMAKWSAMHDLNRTLPDSLRIRVIGIDGPNEEAGMGVSRDEAMFQRFIRAVERDGLQNENFHGLFGYFHVLQGEVSGSDRPLAARLKDAGFPVRSIATAAVDSEVRMPANDQFPTPPDEKLAMLNADGPFILVKGIGDVVAVTAPGTCTLFDLDSEGSPYRTGQRLLGMRVNLMGPDLLPADDSIPTTAFFQQLILVRNSEALSAVVVQ